LSKPYILFIDSGIGGISILNYLNSLHDSLNILYYADSEHFPYGGKEEAVIGTYLLDIYNFLCKEYDIKLIVIACNTASVSALDFLRKRINIPIVGTVPAVKPASNMTLNKNIGIIATKTTVQSGYLSGLIRDFAADSKVFIKEASKLVEAIELQVSESELKEVIDEELSFFNDKAIDTLVLGCTHYSYAEHDIYNYFNGIVKIVDSREGVSKRILSLINDSFFDNDSKKILFLSSKKNIALYVQYNRKYTIFDDLYIKDVEWKKDSFFGV